MADEWGLLGPLVGEWESDRGEAGDPQYSIGEKKYLAEHASTLSYEVTITINDADTWGYDETTMLQMDEIEGPFAHTDHNTLHRAG